MSTDRDAIYQALFNRLKDKFGAPTQTGWLTNAAKTIGQASHDAAQSDHGSCSRRVCGTGA